MVVAMLFVLFSAAMYGFTVILKTWESQGTALDIREDLKQGVEKMVRDLRMAKAISTADDSIRFTVTESGTDNNYIFYLYNASDSWVPDYDEEAYELRKATLTGGINGTFTYGNGPLYIKEIKPPTDSDLSSSGNVLTIDLTVFKTDETFHILQKVRPRNI